VSRRLRRCRFCKNTEHDIRTCPQFLEVVDLKADRMFTARKDILKRFEYYRFGPGSLVQCEILSNKDKWVSTRRSGVIAVVTKILWSSIGDTSMAYTSGWFHQRDMIIKPIDEDSEYTVRLPREIIEVIFEDAGGSWRSEQAFSDVLDRVTIVSSSKFMGAPSSFLEGNEIEIRSKRYTKDYYF
jgi:hypothetical protein